MNSLQNHDHRAILSKQVIVEHLNLFLGNEFCFMCRNLLKNKIFENSLDVCTGTGQACKISNNTHHRRIIEEYWVPFGKQCVDIIMAIGLCPIRFLRSTELSMAIPYVPAAGTYSVHIVTKKDGTTTYELHDTDSRTSGLEPVKDAIVLHGFNFDPQMDGKLNSLVATLRPLFNFVAQLKDSALQAEQIRCNPPVVIQKQEGGNTKQDNDALTLDHFMDTDNLKTSENNTFRRDETSVKALQNQRRMFMNALYPTQGGTNAKNAMDNLLPLPSSFRVGTLLEPSGRSDFVTIQRLAQETICSVLGVPRSLFISDHIVKADSDGIHETLKQTLIFWKNTVATILTKVWRVCTEENLLKEVMQDAKKNKKRALSGAALEKHITKKLPRIEVPISPYCDSAQLRLLYLQEVISWEVYATYLLRNSSLPKDILTSSKDPWTHDDRLQLLGIKKDEPLNQTVDPVSKGLDESSGSGATDQNGTRKKSSSRATAGSKANNKTD